MKHLLTACKSVSDWHTLGTQLDLDKSQLDNIGITYHAHGVDRLKTEMFDAWLKNSPNASWADLITALRAMKENRVANEIENTVYSPIPGTYSPILVLCCIIINDSFCSPLDVLAVQAGGWQQMKMRFYNAYFCEPILATLLVLCALFLYHIWT